VERFLPPFKQTFKCQLSYSAIIGLSSAASGTYQFRANSVFDPDYTGTGGQPSWFDNLKSIYTTYCVTRSSISMAVANLTTSGARFALVPVEDYSVSLSPIQAMELPYCSYGTVCSAVSGTNQLFLGSEIDIGKFMAVRDPQNDDAFRATISSNPALQCYWTLTATSLDGTTLNSSITVRIIYDVTFSSLYPVYDT
jgi:hypothetical protein